MALPWVLGLLAALVVAGLVVVLVRQQRTLAGLERRLAVPPRPAPPGADTRDLDQKAFNLFALYQANKILNLSYDPEVQCRIIVDMFMEVVAASACYLLLFDEAAEVLSLRALKGRDASGIVLRLPPETRDELLRIKEPFRLEQWAVGPLSRGVGEELYRVLRDLEVDLCVPLIQNRSILGLVGLGRRLTGVPMADADRELLATLAGLSANALQNSHLYVLAIFDGLTRVFNHRYFMRRIREEFQRARRYAEPLSLLMVDIDYFKKYNDTHGHLQGDRVLAELAELVMGSLRRDVDIVARYGGEEFACILPETDAAAAFEAAARIRRRVEAWGAERDESAGEPSLTISVGVSTAAADWPPSAEELIEQADQALYAAKRGGRNRVEAARRGDPA
ncbi:MAG TPA: sensor domain-containing diguanylate cyclase [Candidatus Sulfotelmatobacter sp.]|nr:sensor domain-containing diguanylate cyclase [Candidatus Sulfotelmatobacter sp.]